MNKTIINNLVTISGEIASGFNFSHEIYGEKFYIVDVKVQRIIDAYDIVPVMVSERLIDVTENCYGMLICVQGQFRSYNSREGLKNRLVLAVFAKEIEFLDEVDKSEKANQIFLDGYICKSPIYRKTPLGREIADLLIAVNRPYGKSDYIPCICWGRNARYASTFNAGTNVRVFGRIQSREYKKKLSDDGAFETRIAYEASISKLEVHKEQMHEE